MIGYMLEQELCNCLPARPIATLLTQTLVDRHDAAFAAPSKFVGPLYSQEEATQVASERGWRMAADGPGWRRVVPCRCCLVLSRFSASYHGLAVHQMSRSRTQHDTLSSQKTSCLSPASFSTAGIRRTAQAFSVGMVFAYT